MKERTLRILEFNKVKNKLRSYAVTSGGKELIDSLSPYNSIYEVENKLEETNEALDILIKNVTTNKIVLPNPADVPYKQYTLYVRNNNGSGQTVTYGGLDTTNLVTNTAVKTSLNAGEMQVINIVKIPFVSKWLIQNIFNSKVF